MPKLKTDAITEQDIVNYLATDDDFAFEISIFKACIGAGLRAEHGGTYQDPVTKKDRQFDIRAFAKKDNLTVRFAIECKNLRAYYPLLVSRVPLSLKEKYHSVIISGHRDVDVTMESSSASEIGSMPGQYSMHSMESFVGKSTTQVGRGLKDDLVGNDAEVFEKWTQAVASASGLVKESNEEADTSIRSVRAAVILPVLVIPDGTLWVADYSKEGVRVEPPKQVESCLIYLGKEIPWEIFSPTYTFSHLQVFTKTEFIKYLRNFGPREDYWDMLFNERRLSPAIKIFQNRNT